MPILGPHEVSPQPKHGFISSTSVSPVSDFIFPGGRNFYKRCKFPWLFRQWHKMLGCDLKLIKFASRIRDTHSISHCQNSST
jgi:hypothetical protein